MIGRTVDLAGTSLGIYLVGAEIGRGGMGAVHRARTTQDGPAGPAGTEVALKVFHPEQVEDERALARFRLEADIGKEIHHPHLVRSYGIRSAEAGGRTHHFVVMELIEGRTLRDLLAELGTVPESLLHRIADQVLDALDAIHERGVVHRDVKPENIVITPDHRVVVMDLGVAWKAVNGVRAKAGEFVGSVIYAAPEQFEGVEVGPRADLYALGVSLYELATGVNPYGGLDMGAVMARKREGELPPPRAGYPDLSAFWDRVIGTCVRTRPTERFASAAELRRILAEGEAGAWWRRERKGVAEPAGRRALARLQVERRAPLVGRADALRRLQAGWARAIAQGEGGVLVLSGPAGVGKSRLLFEHVRAVAGAGGPALAVGRCGGAGGSGYGAFAEALRDLLVGESDDDALEARLAALLGESSSVRAPLASFLRGRLQPGAESGFSRDALFGAVADVLRAVARERPLAFVVEDLHGAGPESAELFAHLARCARGEPLLLVGTFDADGFAEEDPPLRAWLERAGDDDGVEQLALEPLDGDATWGLVRAVVGIERTVRAVAPLLRAKSGGLPLMVLELLAHLEATKVLAQEDGGLVVCGELDALAVPSTVRDLVGLRLAELGEDARELLETAAVIGPAFSVPLLAAVTEEEPIELLQGLAVLEKQHRMVESAGKDAFRFASASLQEVIYEGIPADLREEYHALVADTLLEAHPEPAGADAHDLLRHLFLAERALEAEPFIEPALEHMSATRSASEAAPFLEKVGAAFSPASPRARLAIAMKLWSFHEMRGSREDEVRALEAAGEVADALGEPGPRARVHALRAGTLWYAGDYDRAGAEAAAGLDLAREAGDEHWEATCLHTLGVVAFRRGEVEPCAASWRQALAIRRRIGDRRGVASTLQALSLVMRAIGEEEQVQATMEEALSIWRSIGERRGEASMLMNLGTLLVDRARYEEALRRFERALQMHRDTGALSNEAMVLTNTGHALNMLGRIDEALTAWQRALDIFIDHGNPNGELAVRAMLGIALAEFGEEADARLHLETAIEIARRTGNRSKLALAQRALGQLLHETGAPAEGWRLLEAALEIDREAGDAGGRVQSLGLMGRAALMEGDGDRAASLLAEALEDARGIESMAPLILARLALAHHLAGRAEEAAARAREALARLDASGNVSSRDGPEMYFAAYRVLGGAALVARARALVEERAAAVRNDTFREHLLERTWPVADILAASRD